MRKKNQKGFTLVELIVVMAIMGIIMAVIMSIIRPTAATASRIESQYDDETVAFQVGKAIKDELSYATQVKIVASKDGTVPSASKTDYTKVFVIDNNYVRHMSRKAATGAVLRGEWDGAKVVNETVLMGEPIYGEDTFRFSIDEFNNYKVKADESSSSSSSSSSSTSNKIASVDPTHYYIILSIKGYRTVPTSDGEAYEADTKFEYKFNQEIEFVNINNSNMILRGGNVNAADFSIQIDENSLLDDYDKIYIFFKPAPETLIGIPSGSVNGSPEESSSGSSDPTSSSTSSTTEPPQLCTVTFYAANGTTKLENYTVNVGDSLDAPSHENDAEDPKYLNEDVTDTSYYSFDGWYTAEGKKISEFSGATGNAMNFYAKYTKKTGVIVTFKDFSGADFKKVKIETGTAPIAPTDNPVPEDASYLFDGWEGTPKFGENLSSATTYTPKKAPVKGFVYVNFVDPFEGKLTLSSKPVSSNVFYNPSGPNLGVSTGDTMFAVGTDSQTVDVKKNIDDKVRFRFSPESVGSVISLTYNNGVKDIDVLDPDTNKPFNYKITNTDFETMALYVYCSDNGKYYAQDSIFGKKSTKVTVSIADKNPTMISFEGSDGYGILRMGSSEMVAPTPDQRKNIVVSDGTVLWIYTNVKFRVVGGEGFAFIKNDGDIAGKTLYIYKNYKNGAPSVTTDPDDLRAYTTIRFRFLEIPSTDAITVKAGGEVYVPDPDNLASDRAVLPADKDYYVNKLDTSSEKILIKAFNDVTCVIDGHSQTIPNSGDTVEVWYYDGNFYIGKDAEKDAKAAYNAANVGNLTSADYGGPAPTAESDKYVFAVDVRENIGDYLHYEGFNFNAKLIEASTNTVLAETNGQAYFDISAYKGNNFRIIVKCDNLPNYGCSFKIYTCNQYGNKEGTFEKSTTVDKGKFGTSAVI